jgi:membrane associated rhomboid family serine protease
LGRAPATAALIGACVLVFLATFVGALAMEPTSDTALTSLWSLSQPQVLELAGGLVLTRVWLDGEWWRVVTAGFCHGSWLHLALNGWALWVVGQWTERAWGVTRHLSVFLVSSVGGCLASAAWAEAPIVVGASAGIFGLAGGLVVARRFGRPEVQNAMRPVASGRLAFWLALWLVVGWQLPMLANAGHLGGLVVGCCAAVFVSFRSAVLRGVGGVLTCACLAALVFAARAPEHRPNYHAFVGFTHLERGEYREAMPGLERALELSPDDSILQNAVAYNLALAGERLDWALELVQIALRTEPSNPDYLDTLGWVQCRRGDVEAGRAALAQAHEAASAPIPEISAHLLQCEGAAIQ